ncbi:S24 family peptidase [Hymenobacter algoricola]|uniref:Peptidase S24/S26A/S26B/S26C domain-containing protein n=1 Tax=Hymenobacter algoricola TaxID=486267 RepID=A0ABP7N9U6_9BACT
MSIHQRVNALIDKMEGGNKSAFARAITLSTGALADIIGGRQNKPSFDVLTKILAAYPLVNPAWLISGEGEGSMLREELPSPFLAKEDASVAMEEPAAPYGKNVRVVTVQVDSHNNENIELVNSRAAAGYVAGGFLEREFISKLPSLSLPDPAYRNGSFRAFQVSGESMTSTLYDRDWVICRYVERWDRDIRDGFVYVVVSEDSLLVKRLQNRLTERGELTLHSDNPAFPVQFLDGASVREVWVAVAKLSRQFVNPRYDVNDELMRTRADVDELLAFMQEMKGRPVGNNPK